MQKKIFHTRYEVHPALAVTDRFFVWGYGTWGKGFLQQWEQEKTGELLGIVDKNASEQEHASASLQAPEALRAASGVTRVVIAIENPYAVQDIRDTLHAWGMDAMAVSTMKRVHSLESVSVDDALAECPDPQMIASYRALLQPCSVRGQKLVRIGRASDGGYVMLDDFRPGSAAYSFGIGTDVSWDQDMAGRGYDVYMYDHTIERLPEDRPGFHFFRKGIAGTEQPPHLDTLAHYIQQNHQEGQQHMILKMDVEGAEWDALLACPEELLQAFDQIVLELHGMCSNASAQKRLRVLEKLDRTHAPVHAHANNWGNEYKIDGRWHTDAWEVTYANRAVYECAPGGDARTELDVPACPDVPDVVLFES